jgi:hypothetical protein
MKAKDAGKPKQQQVQQAAGEAGEQQPAAEGDQSRVIAAQLAQLHVSTQSPMMTALSYLHQTKSLRE